MDTDDPNDPDSLTKQFREATPFPHLVVDHWFPTYPLLAEVLAEIPAQGDEGWHRYDNPLEHKLEGGPHMWGPATWRLADMLRDGVITSFLTTVTGIEGLECDFAGGGWHLIPPGGHLALHCDFNRRADGAWRRLNLLVFLNDGWVPDWGGHLELWGHDPVRGGPGGQVTRIVPKMGRVVVFETNERSWHGHPHPLAAPVPRRSFAAYYYTQDPPRDPQPAHSTIFAEASS